MEYVVPGISNITDLYGYSEYEYEDNQLITVRNYLHIEENAGILRWSYKNEYDDEGRLNKRYFYDDKDELTGYSMVEYK